MQLSRPLIFLDIEATGTDHQRDRIVEIALVRVNVDGSQQERIDRVNPGVRIPVEVVAVHGITNEAVANCPHFREIAPSLLDFMEGCDFGGFGILKFDLPLLTEEFKRCTLPFSLEGRSTVDALAIYHQKEPRDLTAAYKFYCGKDLIGAHGARADTLASMEVLASQLARYADLPQDMETLGTYCRRPDERFVDGSRKFIWKDGEAAFNFGKHRGELLRVLVQNQRDYLQWVIADGKFPQDVVDICYRALRGDFPKKP